MKKISYLFACILLSFCEITLAQNINFNITPTSEIPSPQAFKGFKDKVGYASMPLDLNKLMKVQVKCQTKDLLPTHQQQTTKQYHIYQSGSFDLSKLPFDSEACTMPSKFKNGKGQFYCQQSDILESTVISDTYKDSCGNFYRGFWRVTFLRKNETMGTLFSLGRTLYPKPNSPVENDFEPGDIYPVPTTQFLFFTSLFTADAKKIDELRVP